MDMQHVELPCGCSGTITGEDVIEITLSGDCPLARGWPLYPENRVERRRHFKLTTGR